MIQNIINNIDRFTRWIGQGIAWLTTILVIVIFIDVIVRYFFNASQAWITEFEWHLFALVFLLGAAYTFQDDAHVRVDLFYAKFSAKRKAGINIVGILLFLIPWCLVVLRAANKYAFNSYKIGEASPDPAGLPLRWIIKYAIVAGFLLLLFQAISVMLRSIQVLLGKRQSIFDLQPEEE